jgi:hypothetical protein
MVFDLHWVGLMWGIAGLHVHEYAFELDDWVPHSVDRLVDFVVVSSPLAEGSALVSKEISV